LLATLALFRVERTGFTRIIGTDPDDPACCFDTNADQRAISEGVELGLTSAPTPGVQLTASYVYGRNVTRGSDAARASERFSDETPPHVFQFWGRWNPGVGVWEPFEFGGGLYAQSESSWSMALNAENVLDQAAAVDAGAQRLQRIRSLLLRHHQRVRFRQQFLRRAAQRRHWPARRMLSLVPNKPKLLLPVRLRVLPTLSCSI